MISIFVPILDNLGVSGLAKALVSDAVGTILG